METGNVVHLFATYLLTLIAIPGFGIRGIAISISCGIASWHRDPVSGTHLNNGRRVSGTHRSLYRVTPLGLKAMARFRNAATLRARPFGVSRPSKRRALAG